MGLRIYSVMCGVMQMVAQWDGVKPWYWVVIEKMV